MCIVCGSDSTVFFKCIDKKTYRRCEHCEATFLNPQERLSEKEEYARYCLHRNDPSDEGYRRFLSKLAGPLAERLLPGAEGLDYGCGPGPALVDMLQEAGYSVEKYDPFFCPDPQPLRKRYDFITCTETIEHFYSPAHEFVKLDGLLKPNGWLAIMTCFQTDDRLFASWHYRRDSTHVVFYREKTFRIVAGLFGWTCEIPVKDVALMQKTVKAAL